MENHLTRDLNRLIRPKSIAVVGGGNWCADVIRQTDIMGFKGPVWPVHPKARSVAGHKAFKKITDLPAPPDAVFVGVNRHATIGVVEQLAKFGAGGAVCFASGFSEANAEDAIGSILQDQLVTAASGMPILGPNCYGFINALDGALLWPDQHGCKSVKRGVAILTQSSNIAINLTMQKRGLPIAYTVTCGNMAQTSQAEIAAALLDDARVTAIGLHIEGFGDTSAWEKLAQKAYAKKIPMIALKVGASDQAQSATISHTASLAGSDTGAEALLKRLGIARVKTLPDMLETLKLLHCLGPLQGTNIASISCSGGEASLIADMAMGSDLTFPPLSLEQQDILRTTLGPMVALNNPLDYHTYIWRDPDAMSRAWAGMTGPNIDMTFTIVDYPKTDPKDWDCATQAALLVRKKTGAPFAVVASIPELMPEHIANKLIQGGVVPFNGLREAIVATQAASNIRHPANATLLKPGITPANQTLTEIRAKQEIARYGVCIPRYQTATQKSILCRKIDLNPPFAIKGIGLAHKTEYGAILLSVLSEELAQAAATIGTPELLIEEMVSGSVVELLVGIIRDPAHGFILTVGAGGILSEVLKDTASLLLPTTAADIEAALSTLNCFRLLQGYRGKPSANLASVVRAILALQSYVIANADTVSEVEINPLICTSKEAIAADALIRKA